MKDEQLHEFAVRIRLELDEIRRVLARISAGWERARISNDDFYFDGVALNLHGFYMGVERIFTHIAELVDGALPRGDSWHLLLLKQMTEEVPGIRPPVISTEAGTKLDEYRRFRHIVRNVYTQNFDPAKLGALVSSAQPLFDQFKAEIEAFVAFLERKGEGR
jgi:hypothetical protein